MDHDIDVAGALGANPSDLVQLTGHPDLEVRIELAQNPILPEIALRNLAHDDSCLVRQFVGGHQNTPSDVLEMLASDVDWEVRLRVAQNPGTPIKCLEEMATDRTLVTDIDGFEMTVQQCVAGNPSASVGMLQALMEIEDCRSHVAGNPSVPIELLEQLVFDPSSDVRLSLASNPRANESILEALRKDEHPQVRAAAASYTNQREIVSDEPSHDDSLMVELSALQDQMEFSAAEIKDLLSIANKADGEIARELVSFEEYPPGILMVLALSDDGDVRDVVASDARLTFEVADVLGRDPEELVRASLASNETCPPEILERLASDKSGWVSETAEVYLENL